MYRTWVKISLVLVYLVIVAGAMVRMTGSGMGCPDWPKCFGYYIPPTDRAELEFHPEHRYEKGQVIIMDESLKVASRDFTSGANYNAANWQNYEKHDYAIFNPTHTWVEYINRLVGALAGLAVVIMALFSFGKIRLKKRIPVLSCLCVFLMGFQAWLGATVVYSVLAPAKITIHMVMALVIVALLLYLLFISSEKDSDDTRSTANFKTLMIVATIFTLIQVVLGTQVRQFIDEQVRNLGYASEELWLNDPNITFYIHRSFSILVLLVNLWLWYRNRKLQLGLNLINWVMALILIEVITGIVMYYFDFPVLSQPVHLVIASILFGIQFYLLMQTFDARKKIEIS
ncbi:COX15/CtaA family protein [Christiangramia flava]|uniref:Heme A synthase, cytochrome oxidase biogenesis protein Cox15-CtaA n=1 Tax=Christiangramia flava JLT2011 TaxID=1229726 RepID=A0A1L7I6M6_9FLAO|nr:COX15/CtaA family protein [Christiangramia flava]APU69250.1 Heme A synthase, cytochrome oxidase biogenesis protein Cox15-CtaA [Christiangramia flava JLT2011]OSS38851.1 Heme A synthase, cytochrome oxidase biogenesis protein Cox15-CtaA [Christiangramia flava JLT2011]